MDLTISKSELSKAIQVTQSIVEKRATMPILANVLLTAADGKLKISATDLEITAVVTAQARVKAPGSTTVSAKVFSELARELPDGDVRIKLSDGERIEITCGKSKYRINAVSADEYPSLPGISFDVRNKISAKQLQEMINKTIYAVSQDETRFNLNGVCFEIVSDGKKQKALKMVATDGHRLAIISRPIGDLNLKDRVIVPRKGLAEIRKVLELQQDNEIGFDINEGFLVLESKECKISMRLIDAEYPDYTQVIPKHSSVVAALSSDELSQALRRVALMVTDKSKCIKLDFNGDTLKVQSSSPELGDAHEELAIQYNGKPLSIGFNAKYLLDIAASLGENQTLNIELNGELGPGKFSSANDSSYFGIVMPMRLSN